MEFKGTKGWNAKHQTVEFCDTGDYEYHATIEDEKGRCIAQFFAKDEDQREADCNLAACAYELLKELQQTVKALEVIATFGATKPIIARAKSTINKALGKEATDE